MIRILNLLGINMDTEAVVEGYKNTVKNKYWQKATVFLICGLISLSFEGMLGVIIPTYGFIGFIYWASKFFGKK